MHFGGYAARIPTRGNGRDALYVQEIILVYASNVQNLIMDVSAVKETAQISSFVLISFICKYKLVRIALTGFYDDY